MEGGFTQDGISRQTPKLHKIYIIKKKKRKRRLMNNLITYNGLLGW